MSQHFEKWGVIGLEPEEGTEGVIGHDLLGEGIAQGIFKAVPVLEAVLDPKVLADDVATIGLGILDCCDLLGVLDVVVPTLIAPTLWRCLPRNNKHLGLYLLCSLTNPRISQK